MHPDSLLTQCDLAGQPKVGYSYLPPDSKINQLITLDRGSPLTRDLLTNYCFDPRFTLSYKPIGLGSGQ